MSIKQRVEAHELAHVYDIFRRFDRDASGDIDAGELAQLAEAFGAELSSAELAACVAAIDADGDGRIQYQEFVAWWSERFLPEGS